MSSPPAWSMGTSQRKTNFGNTRVVIPGPGTYESSLIDKMKQPSWKVGTKERVFDYSTINPGPGTYSIPQHIAINAPKYQFGIKASLDLGNQTPGPGNYETIPISKKNTKTPSYTMGGRDKDMFDIQFKTPGPGAYEKTSQILIKSAPKAKIGTGKRLGAFVIKNTPGPGTYHPIDNRAPEGKLRFGSEERANILTMGGKLLDPLPGPGTYNLRKEPYASSSATNIARKIDESLQDIPQIPSLNQYDGNKLGKKSLSAYKLGTFSKEERPSRYKNDPKLPLVDISKGPGPGQYEIGSTLKGPRWGAGTDKRNELTNGKTYLTPGPGSYNIPAKFANVASYAFKNKSSSRS